MPDEYIFAQMSSEELLLRLVALVLAALAGGWLLERLHQPSIMGYILAGVVLGNEFRSFIPSRAFLEHSGDLGLVFMLFFIGTEVDIARLLKDWKIPLLGTLLGTAVSVAVCLLSGIGLDWTFGQSLFFGFMISLSSTAVVLRILQDFGGADSFIGRKSLSILLLQDLMVIPMLIVMGMFRSEGHVDYSLLARQVFGGILVTAVAVFLGSRTKLKIPDWLRLHQNYEFRVLAGLVFSLGAATITGYLGLSPALGAFLSGIIFGRMESQLQLHSTLQPFKVLFVAIFFITIGLLVDLDFLWLHLGRILLLVLMVFLLNTLVTAGVLRFLGVPTIESIVTGCLLAQIGEFAFLLASSARHYHMIDIDTHKTAVAVIALSLLLTPLWFGIARKLMRFSIGTSATRAFDIIPKHGPLTRIHQMHHR